MRSRRLPIFSERPVFDEKEKSLQLIRPYKKKGLRTLNQRLSQAFVAAF